MGFLVEEKLADDAVRRNVAAGGHYFDRDTLRCFGSKVHEGYDIGDGSTLVIMSNKDKGYYSVLAGQYRQGVVRGRRHYYFVVIDKDGNTDNGLKPEEFKYDVSKDQGYWLTLRQARAAVKRYIAAQEPKAEKP